MEIPNLDWEQGVVSFLHHSYTPFKDGHGGPNTWHWDNVEINPAIPITVLPAHQRWVNEDHAVLTFPSGAPEEAFLRGTAIGTKLEISFDNGVTWQQTRQQPSEKMNKPTWQFWHPVPPGTREIVIRKGEKHPAWWSSQWIAKGISLFSRVSSVNPMDSPPPPMAHKTECRKVIEIQQRIAGQWITLDTSETLYKGDNCLPGTP